MNAGAGHELPAWGKHPVLFVTMVLFAVGWFVLPAITNSFSGSDDLPYETWWAIWALIAVCNIPVFGAVRRTSLRYPDSGGGILMVLLALLPPGLAMLLLGIAGSCANLAAITGRSSSGCATSNRALGWIGLIVGSALLIGAAVYVVYLEPPGTRQQTD